MVGKIEEILALLSVDFPGSNLLNPTEDRSFIKLHQTASELIVEDILEMNKAVRFEFTLTIFGVQ
jgi:hypothetical protein